YLCNNIIYNNKASMGNNIFSEKAGGLVAIEYSLIENGLQNVNYISINYANIDADPLFRNPSIGVGYFFSGLNADWRLSIGSPCIDHGSYAKLNLPTTDYYGNFRIYDGDNDNIPQIDIGIHEYGSPIPVAPQITSLPDTTSIEDSIYQYQIECNAYPPPFYEILKGPDDFLIDSTSGLISWIPTNDDVGEIYISIKSSNIIGFDIQNYLLHVINVNDSPIIKNLPDSVCFFSFPVWTIHLDEHVEDVDSPDSTLQWSIVGNKHIFAYLNDTTNILTLSSPPGWSGYDTLYFTVRDDCLAEDSHTLVIHVLLPTKLISKKEIGLPNSFLLFQNYPNPFNCTTLIKYQLPIGCKLTIDIFNLVGQKITTLLSSYQPPGYYEITWNINNIPSGIYYYRISCEKYNDIKKCVIIR
ncbi:T9SS type A sorting domain-containing protein, partial [candidate division KSB1 bacterium]|nr:T9SS type A sorting domain-containing protein [candidate division KSB1 bacterium]